MGKSCVILGSHLVNQYEFPFWQQNKIVLGLDEAGRGPIAGELVVAGVVFPVGYQNTEINDSKKLNEKKRNKLFEVIKEDALLYQIVIVPNKDIDKYNIYQATRMAMEAIAEKLNVEQVLTDAMPLRIEDFNVQAIVKGDQKSISIAAASILAKVTRDQMMIAYDKKYPEYGFARHKGYPTKQHLKIINEIGICEIHRLSYQPVRQVILDLGID